MVEVKAEATTSGACLCFVADLRRIASVSPFSPLQTESYSKRSLNCHLSYMKNHLFTWGVFHKLVALVDKSCSE